MSSDSDRLLIGIGHSSLSINRKLKLGVRRNAFIVLILADIQSSLRYFTELNFNKEAKMTFEQYKKRRNASMRFISSATEVDWQQVKLSKNMASNRITMILMVVSLTFTVLNLPQRVHRFYLFLNREVIYPLGGGVGVDVTDLSDVELLLE